ncbi:MAG: hypothetical protein RLY93_03085 [Sumerlaeia bacterium]
MPINRTPFFLQFALLLAALGLTLPALAQPTVYDFDDGTTQSFQSITRPDTYNDEPAAVTADADFPGAFPPPSGTFALRVADDDNDSFGLASAVGGTAFDRTAVSFTSATLTAKIYVVASAAANEGNVALLAINDGTLAQNEAYYRFGYRNNEVFLQRFGGASFTTLGTDTALDDSNMTIPGWNTFQITFVGADQIQLSVNGAAPSFSPVTDTLPAIDTEIQVGVLGFNISSFNGILADDITQEVVTGGASVNDWSKYD